jgi:hypothetical protein
MKVTGHGETIAQVTDYRYLSANARDRWGISPLTSDGIKALEGKTRCIYGADPGGEFERVPAEIDIDGKGTGLISPAYVARLLEMQSQGKIIAQRIVLGPMELCDDHGFTLAHERSLVVPLTLEARLRAQELSWNEALPAAAGRLILSRMMREAIKPHVLIRRAVKGMTGGKKKGKTIAGHNLVLAPHPRLLQRIRAAGQCVDTIMEIAARRAIEKMERRIGAKIVAVAATHIEDSSGVRPHLHIRMSAYATDGKYIPLFDRKGGGGGSGAAGGGGGRCLLQPEVERQIVKIIERWEPRERN